MPRGSVHNPKARPQTCGTASIASSDGSAPLTISGQRVQQGGGGAEQEDRRRPRVRRCRAERGTRQPAPGQGRRRRPENGRPAHLLRWRRRRRAARGGDAGRVRPRPWLAGHHLDRDRLPLHLGEHRSAGSPHRGSGRRGSHHPRLRSPPRRQGAPHRQTPLPVPRAPSGPHAPARRRRREAGPRANGTGGGGSRVDRRAPRMGSPVGHGDGWNTRPRWRGGGTMAASAVRVSARGRGGPRPMKGSALLRWGRRRLLARATGRPKPGVR